jgi:selenocysteine lyase/cysteine desulfurase
MKDKSSATIDTPEALSIVERLRSDTPGCRDVIHFNNAGSGLLATPVLDAMLDHLRLEAAIGGYEAADARRPEIDDFYAAVADLINARPTNIAFASSATDAYTRAVSSIPFQRGDVVLTTRNDFISNQIAFLSLQKRFGIEVIQAPDLDGARGVDVEAMTVLMRRLRPRLVAVTHVPTNSGLVQPIEAIGKVCRELDLLYLVDACQSVGQFEVDVEAIGCDFLTATCRKFLRGPRGTGFLFVSDRVLSGGYEPLFIDMYGARWTGPDAYQPAETAARFEDWEFPFAAVIGSAVAVRYALDVGPAWVSSRTPAMGELLRDGLDRIPGVRTLDRGERRAALVTFQVKGWEAQPFKEAMDARAINSALSFRNFAVFDFVDKDVDWCLRLSPHYYNTEAEIGAVIEAVSELVRAGRSR